MLHTKINIQATKIDLYKVRWQQLLTGPANSTSKILKKDYVKVLEYNSISIDIYARFQVIVYETSKCVVDKTQYKAIISDYHW